MVSETVTLTLIMRKAHSMDVRLIWGFLKFRWIVSNKKRRKILDFQIKRWNMSKTFLMKRFEGKMQDQF